MKKPFEQSSYLAQVRRLTALARTAAGEFPLKVKSLRFIHHGENATFCLTARNGRRYLLRIHREGYHSFAAIQEELRWLTRLSREGLPVPKPVRSRSGRLVERVSDREFSRGRHVCVFEWTDGRFIDKSVAPHHMEALGRLIAEVQARPPRGGVRHRRYWTATGLVGMKSKFGSINRLEGIRASQQQVLNRARAKVWASLRAYERRYPERLGMIHADPHFGNLLSTPNGLALIDFDDSGYGFFVYDLAVALLSARNQLGKKRKREFPALQEALIRGYASRASWDNADLRILPTVIRARELMAVGWLNSRRENPRLRPHFKRMVRHVVRLARHQGL